MDNSFKLVRFILFIMFLTSLAWADDNSGLSIVQKNTPVERRTALVIGNASYANAPLHNPLNDARDIARILRKQKFQTILVLDADKRQMIQAIRNFGNEIKNGGVGLFYYAGHGIQVDGRNYLIPTKANIEIENEIPLEAVDVNRVLGYMDAAGNHLNIVILDACRDNPFARSFRSASKGLAQMDAPNGTLIAYATSPGKTAADGSGTNGVYTKHLMEQMQRPGLEIGQMFRLARKGVRIDTAGKQIPWESTSLEGSFYFSSVESQKMLPAPIIRQEPVPEPIPQPLLESGLQTYRMINTVDSNGARIPLTLHMDVSNCQLKIDSQATGEWVIKKIIPKFCEAARRFNYRVVNRNGYWADYDWRYTSGTVVHGKWKDSYSNFGTTVGVKTVIGSQDGRAVYSLMNIFKNKETLVPFSFRVGKSGCTVIKEENQPNNEWRITKFVTKTCEPSRRIRFRTVHQNGYWVDYDWSFSEGPMIMGTWIDSNNDTGTSVGAKE